MILRLHLFLIIFYFFTAYSFSAEDNARALYDQAKYSESLALIQKNGFHSSADYNNAGLSAFRLGNLGLSYSYFLKAHTLNPDNDDYEYNLALSESELEKTGSLLKDNSLLSGKIIPYFKKQNEETLLLIPLFFSVLVAISVWLFKKRKQTLRHFLTEPLTLSLFLLWIFSSIVGLVASVLKHNPSAVVISNDCVARSGPSEKFTELFKAPAGTRLELSNQSRDGWVKIRFSLGNVGWIMEKDLLKL